MRKRDILFIFIFLFALISFVLFLFFGKEIFKTKKADFSSGPQTIEEKRVDFKELVRFCLQNGGEFIEIRPDKEKKERAHCIFEDKSECDLEDFYKKACKKGEKKCRDFCGDGVCQQKEICIDLGCICPESRETCPIDCQF